MDYKKPIEEVIEKLKEFGLDRRAIEERLDYSVGSIDQTLSRGGNKKMLAALKMLLELEILTKSRSDSVIGDIAYSSYPDLNMKTIAELAESNRLLAQSSIVFAESHKNISETNKRLADRVLSQSANVEQQTLPSVDTTLNNLLGLIADVAAGKRFESRREALTVIHKLMHDKTQSNILEGTQKG